MAPVTAGAYSAFMLEPLNPTQTHRRERELALTSPLTRERLPGVASTSTALSAAAPETTDRPLLTGAQAAQSGGKTVWRGFVEPVIFAVALVAAMLTMNQWFSEPGTQAPVPALMPQVAIAPR